MASRSKAVKISRKLLDELAPYKTGDATWSDALEVVMEKASGQVTWTLPSYTFKTKKEAIREAMEQAVLSNKDYEDMEQPIKVRL